MVPASLADDGAVAVVIENDGAVLVAVQDAESRISAPQVARSSDSDSDGRANGRLLEASCELSGGKRRGAVPKDDDQRADDEERTHHEEVRYQECDHRNIEDDGLKRDEREQPEDERADPEVVKNGDAVTPEHTWTSVYDA